MQGVILNVGSAQSLILGDDGTRYTFTPLGWQNQDTRPQVGMRVDFEVRGSHAVGVHPIPGAAPTPPVQPPAASPTPPTVLGGYPGQPTQPPSAYPTTAGALPAQPPPPSQPPPTKSGFGTKWWHWVLSGGTALVIVGVIGVFAMGIFPTDSEGEPGEVVQPPPHELTVTPGPQPTPDPQPTPGPSPTPGPLPTPTPIPFREMNFSGLVVTTNLPSQVQVVFSLRDQEGHAIVRPAEQVEQGTRVFEKGPGTNDSWEEIDYAETSFFVHTAENIDLEIVFILDFTNSMSQASLSDGRSGIEAMLQAFEASLAELASAHRVGVVEFHDRNARPRVLSHLTTDRQAVLGKVRDFQASGFDSGSSRVWDSVVIGSDLFSSSEQNPRVVRALVFLSDGRDTSSDNTREQARRYADGRDVQLYALGVGDVFQEEELRSMARLTDGAYYPARDLNLIQTQLQQLVNDLRGQYQLTYITLRRTGKYSLNIKANMEGVSGETLVGLFDVASFFGSDNQGAIEFDPPSLDLANRRATLFMRASHIPRNIDRIRFRAQTSKPLHVDLVPSEDGGLLEGWRLSGPGPGGWYEAVSDTPLEFGALGLLAKLTFSDLDENGLETFVEFDNSIYTGGKTLAESLFVRISDVVGPSAPAVLGRIALHSDRDGDFDIYVMNADGSDAIQLTRNSAGDFEPRWSPDGRRIAFSSDRDGDFDIYVMNTDGSSVVQLTDSPTKDTGPSWSPDGRRIIFSSELDEDWNEIYAMNADGSDVVRLTDNMGAYSTSPSWSPDGLLIAFQSDRDGDFDIYVMNADGSDVTQITDNSVGDFEPRWSPDGRHIAFSSGRDEYREIYVMTADGSDVTQLTSNLSRTTNPSWSSDGRRIAFSSGRDEYQEIYVVNADGSDVVPVTNNRAVDGSPVWSAASR